MVKGSKDLGWRGLRRMDKDWEEVTWKGKKLLEKYGLESDDCVSFLGARVLVAQRSYAVSAGTGKICTVHVYLYMKPITVGTVLITTMSE
jgi:hypothetical protein